MYLNFINNANLTKILISVFFLFIAADTILAQEDAEDPISEAIQKEKQEYYGPNFTRKEYEEYNKIHQKYQLTEKEQIARSKYQSGQKLGLMDRFRVAKGNRKDYLKKKKMEQFMRKKLLSKQSEATKKRMIENEKRTKARYKRVKRKQKRKSFFNLFR